MDKDARYMAAKCRRLAETLGEQDARTLRDLAAEYDRQTPAIANENANQNTAGVAE
jgi:predicted transcriptional regulator